MVGDRPPLHFLKKGETIFFPGLKDITDDHDRGMEVIGDIEDILSQKLGIPIGWLPPVGH